MLYSMYNRYDNQQGFLGVVTVLIVAGITLTISVTIAVLGISESLMGFGAEQSTRALQRAEGCSEEAYYRLKRNPLYTGGTIPYAGGSCTVTISGSGSTRTINTTAVYTDYTRSVEANISFESNIAGNAEGVDLSHWEEQ